MYYSLFDSQLQALVDNVDEAEATNQALLAMIRKHGLESAWMQQTVSSRSTSASVTSSTVSPHAPVHVLPAASSASQSASASAAAASPASASGHGFGFAASRGKAVHPVPVVPLTMPPSASWGGGGSAVRPVSAASSAGSVETQGSPGSGPAAASSAAAQRLAELSGDDAQLLSSVSAAQTHFIITDPTLPDNPIVFASAGFYHLTGYSPQDILGHNCRFLQGRDTDSRTVARLSKAVQAGIDCRAVVLNYTKTGVPFWNDLFVAPLKDRHGRVVHFVGVQSNISPARANALLALMGPYGGVVTSEPLPEDTKVASSTGAHAAAAGKSAIAHGMSDQQLQAAVQAQGTTA